MKAVLAQKTSHLAWVDTLRGIAILMVIAVHVGHGLKGYASALTAAFSFGGYGVQLFFVASAFTLCVSMDREYGKPQWLLRYAIRRYFRIAPMYYVGIVLYFLWSFAKNQVKTGHFLPEPQYNFWNIVANIFFFHGYLPDAYNDIVPGGWSIAVETSFYLIFPLIFALFRVFRNNPFGLTMAIMLGCWFLASWAQQVTGRDARYDDYIYFNIANQLQVFIVAMGGYMAYERLRQVPAVAMLLVLCALLFLAKWILNIDIFNAKFWGLSILAAAFFVLGLFLARLDFSNYFLEEIGQRSFSMYVLHFFILNIIEYIFNVRWLILADQPLLKAVVHFGVAAWGAYFLSGLTKKHIEDRFIAWGSRFSKMVST